LANLVRFAALKEKQSPWDEVQAPGNIYEEQMRPLEKWLE
jgi:hypothetical protein